MRPFLRHGALVLAGSLLLNALTYVYYAAVSRTVGVEAAGLFTSLIAAILVLSLPSAVAAFIFSKLATDAGARNERGALVALGRYASGSILPIAVLGAVASTIAASAVGDFFHATDRLVFALAGAGLAFTFPLAPQRAVLQGGSRFYAFTVSNVVEGTVKGTAGIVIVAMHLTLRAALAGYALAMATAFLSNVALLHVEKAPFQALRFSTLPIGRLISGAALPFGAITAMTFMDVVLVRHFLSPRDAGLYGAAALVGRAILTVTQFVPTLAMPYAANAISQGRSPRLVLAAAGALITAIVAVILTLVAVAPGLIVTVVSGRAFAAAAPIVLPYAVAMSALAGATMLCAYLVGTDRHAFALPLTVIGVVEISAVAAFHDSIRTVVTVVVVGHLSAFAATLVDALLSLAAAPGRGERPMGVP